MNLKKKKKGFTLIELMAVIAIIAILAAVLVPTVSGYIERSKKTAIITQVRNVVNAVETYNATSDSKGQIKLATKLTNIKTLVGEDLLKGIDKLDNNMTYATLKHINENTNAIKDIVINSDGKIIEYNNEDTINEETDGTTLQTAVAVKFKAS